MMINNSTQSGYYDMDNNMVIGDNSSEVDVLNTTPFSVRDILNIVDQSHEDNHYQAMNGNEQFSQKFYGNNMSSQAGNNSQYKR
jgi:hypothetical protein